ncbi:hypothetical protein SDJN03_18011, partial [Cucurbita argyrosperma subsp. sororia]
MDRYRIEMHPTSYIHGISGKSKKLTLKAMKSQKKHCLTKEKPYSEEKAETNPHRKRKNYMTSEFKDVPDLCRRLAEKEMETVRKLESALLGNFCRVIVLNGRSLQNCEFAVRLHLIQMKDKYISREMANDKKCVCQNLFSERLASTTIQRSLAMHEIPARDKKHEMQLQLTKGLKKKLEARSREGLKGTTTPNN